MPQRVDRSQVLAYRAAAQGLHRNEAASGDLLRFGVQDTPPGSAATAFAVRAMTTEQDALATTWTLRGAPHVHRREELVGLAGALWPWSDDDALARLDTSASNVRASGMPARDALRFVAERIAEIVTEPMPKGEVSTALTPSLPPELTVDCRRCRATHVVETLWRSAILPAGIVFAPDERTVTFTRLPDWPGVPHDTAGDDRVMTAYLRLLGPAGPAEVAGVLATRPAEVADRWPDGLVEVDVGDTRRWITEDAVPLLLAPPDPPAVRLLPPSDPWLQARDRSLIVPDAGHRKVLWPILGRPGAILLHGEVVGAWRARRRGRRLEVTAEPFGDLSAAVIADLEDEAQLVAQARGATNAEFVVASG